MMQFKLTTRKLWTSCLALVIIFSTSCVKDERIVDQVLVKQLTETSSELSVGWMNLAIELTKETPGYTSPVAARTHAYLGLAMYELLVPGMENYRTMQGKLNGFKLGTMPSVTHSDMDWSISFNEAMYQLFSQYFRNTTQGGWAIIDKHYNSNLEKLSVGLSHVTINNSMIYGQVQAKALYNYSLTDGQDNCSLNNYPENFTAPNGQGLWIPTPNLGKPLQPYWGEVRTFINYNQVRTETLVPPGFSQDKNSTLYRHALEVRNRVENLSKYEVQMVKYWNDEQEGSITPSGHMLSILGQILSNENKDLGFSAYAYMKLGIALHDATVMAWKTKYTYFTMRPESYIKEYIDRDFLPFINPNSTPEYSSGLSSAAAAAVEVMGSLFGHNFAFTDKTYEYRKDIEGTPRSYKSFDHMLTEVSSAALLGGIHYRFSIEAGERQGFDIGKGINAIR